MPLLDAWKEFPKIGLIVDGKKKFYPLREAVPIWDSGWVRVEDTGELLEADFSVRKMTREENQEFQSRVDEYSARR